MLGGGLEYAFTDAWSAKIEYNYLDFGTRASSSRTRRTCSPSVPTSGNTSTSKTGVNYRFGWAPSGPVLTAVASPD
jgi:outer membrane immunogenic protein